METIARQQSVVLVDEVQSHLQSGQRVAADVLAAERLDEREKERNGAISHRRIGDVHER